MDSKLKNKLPRGVKKHIRIEKARIRVEFLNTQDQTEEIQKLYNKFALEKGVQNKQGEDQANSKKAKQLIQKKSDK